MFCRRLRFAEGRRRNAAFSRSNRTAAGCLRRLPRDHDEGEFAPKIANRAGIDGRRSARCPRRAAALGEQACRKLDRPPRPTTTSLPLRTYACRRRRRSSFAFRFGDSRAAAEEGAAAQSSRIQVGRESDPNAGNGPELHENAEQAVEPSDPHAAATRIRAARHASPGQEKAAAPAGAVPLTASGRRSLAGASAVGAAVERAVAQSPASRRPVTPQARP
jgi:hypothetical protein